MQSKQWSKCQFLECDFHFKTLYKYRQHLENVHGIENKLLLIDFSSQEDFSTWKEQIETTSSANFAMKCSELLNDTKKEYFYCNRSGCVKLKENTKRVRQLKSQGSRKIDARCPAGFTATRQGDSVHVKYYATHVGHDKLLGHTTLPSSVRSEIAGKLAQGLPGRRILDDIRSSVDKKVCRSHLITRKDVNNIRKRCGIPRGQLSDTIHSNDELSVEAWVESQRTLTPAESSLLFYKPEGEEHRTLSMSDFVLVIMTPFQRNLSTTFSSDRVCMDSTPGDTGYNLTLTTLLIVDNYEEGFLAGFCISSAVNMNILTVYLDAVKEAIGLLEPTYFISDDLPLFYNAWCSVMNIPRKILCAWHVDRAWHKNIRTICDLDKRANVYKLLKDCMYEVEIDKFNIIFKELLKQLGDDEECTKFCDYLQRNYCSRVEMWAFSYRVNSSINTNLYLENVHKQFKHYYKNAKKCKRVDRLVHTLLEYVNDKVFDRFCKLHKGIITTKDRRIMQKHTAGESLVLGCNEQEDGRWQVSCGKNIGVVYSVQKILHNCISTTCGVQCSLCKACLLQYTCTCLDYTINSNFCEHIHAVNIYQNSEPSTSLQKPPTNETFSASDILMEVEVESQPFDSAWLSESLNKCKKANTIFDPNIAELIMGHIKCIQKLVNIKSIHSVLDCKRKVQQDAANKLSIKQSWCNSTKKALQSGSKEGVTTSSNHNLPPADTDLKHFPTTTNHNPMQIQMLRDPPNTTSKYIILKKICSS